MSMSEEWGSDAATIMLLEWEAFKDEDGLLVVFLITFRWVMFRVTDGFIGCLVLMAVSGDKS